jgi:hypothetical protein
LRKKEDRETKKEIDTQVDEEKGPAYRVKGLGKLRSDI